MAGLVWTVVSMDGAVATVLISFLPPFDREKNAVRSTIVGIHVVA